VVGVLDDSEVINLLFTLVKLTYGQSIPSVKYPV